MAVPSLVHALVCVTLLASTSFMFSNGLFHRRTEVVLEANCSGTNESGTVLDDCVLCSCTGPVKYLLKAECTITDGDLIHIMSLLQDAWSIITGTFSNRGGTRLYADTFAENSNCTSTSRTVLSELLAAYPIISSACDELLAGMETLILDITEQIRRLINWLDDPGNFHPEIARLEKCLGCVKKQMEDIQRSHNDTMGNFTEHFGNMQQCFQNSINERMKEIADLQFKLERKSYTLITNSVNASNYQIAFSEFTHLNDDTILANLVVDLYGSEKLENLLHFAFLLPKPSQRAIVYDKIQALMQQHDHYKTMRTLSLHKIVYDDLKRICGTTDPTNCPDLPAQYKLVLTMVNLYVDYIKLSLQDDICNDKHRPILVTGSPENMVNLAGEAFTNVLAEVIKKTYSRCHSKLDIILKFLVSLQWNKQIPVGFEALLSVSNTNEKLRIAYKLKEAAENLVGPDGNVEKVEDEIFRLKNLLPQPVRSIVWHRTCHIMTASGGGYLTIDGSLLPGNSRIITRSGNNTWSDWILEPMYRDGNLEYQLRNANTGDRLATHIPWRNTGTTTGYGAASTPDDGVFSARHYNWEIHFVDGTGNLGLYHIGRRGYLEGGYINLAADKGTNRQDWKVQCTE